MNVECDICETTFDNLADFKTHNQSVHQILLEQYRKKIHACDLCHKTFSSPSDLKRHKKSVHDRIRDEKCHACEKAFRCKQH